MGKDTDRIGEIRNMENELISRQAAIDAIENAFDRETILNRFVRKIAISAIRLLPSAQPEPHWIPCSERMPELDSDGCSDKVLVCFSNFPGAEICEYRVMNGTGKWYARDTDYSPEDIGVNVIAWQPLPEPYREDGNE